MALETHVQNRYSNQLLVQWTNPQNSTATTIDSDRLGYACDDVEAWFKILAGVAYDDTDARHIAVAVEGVQARLKNIAGIENSSEWDNWKTDMKDFAKVTGRDRIKPTTTSTLDPTDERSGDGPWSDRSAFDRLIPDSPASDSRPDNTQITTD